MRCRPGDLAFVSDGLNDGKIVRVVRPGDDWSEEGDSRFHWECDTLGQALKFAPFFSDGTLVSDGIETVDFADAELRPIRDSDGVDEMIIIAGKPQKEPA